MITIKILQKYISSLLVISLILLANSCDQAEAKVAEEKVQTYDSLEGSWRLLRIESGEKSDFSKEDDPLLAEAEVNNDAVKGLILSFFADSTYTVICADGSYIPGVWTKQNEMVALRPDADRNKVLAQEFTQRNNEIKLRNARNNMASIYALETKPVKRAKEDPFHKENNTWRIAAIKKETKQELKERIINIVKHYTYILKAAKDQNLPVVSFVFSRALINIYNGGIGVVSTTQLPDEWIKTFYSREQAMEAYDIFENYLGSTSYRAASTGNWIEDDYNILLAIYAGLKGGKK